MTETPMTSLIVISGKSDTISIPTNSGLPRGGAPLRDSTACSIPLEAGAYADGCGGVPRSLDH
jgi:hypothetical protein